MPGKLTARGFRIWDASTRKKGMELAFSQINSCNTLRLVQRAQSTAMGEVCTATAASEAGKKI